MTTQTFSPDVAWVTSSKRLPRWASPSILLGSFGLVALGQFLLGGINLPALITCAVLLFAVGNTAVSWRFEGKRWAQDRLASTGITVAFGLAIIPLITLLSTVISKGIKLFSLSFLSDDMRGIYGDMTSGGVHHAIIGTLLVTLAAAVVAIPIGLMTAVYLVEYGNGRLAKAITIMVDIMTGIPSIVAGLFAFALFTMIFGPAYRSGLMGAVALAVLMIPVVVRSVEEMLRLVPNELREASYALGVPKWLTIIKVVLRTALAGITTGIFLAVARVIGETAPLLITVGILQQVNWDLFDGRMTTLPVFAYSQYQSGGVGVDRAWAAALTLIILVMLLNLVARVIGRIFAPKVSR